MKKTLLIIDLQNDFISGSLAVKKSSGIIKPIIKLSKEYNFVLASKDWHPLDHKSFNRFGGSWPVHCVKDTWGSSFPEIINKNIKFDLVIKKGIDKNIESYSAFSDEEGKKSMLENFLKENQIKEIDIVGLAFDYCVYYTAIDLAKRSFRVKILESYCKSVSEHVSSKREKLSHYNVILEK